MSPQGYIGHWGGRCEGDPLNRRAGDLMPDFRVEMLRCAVADIAALA